MSGNHAYFSATSRMNVSPRPNSIPADSSCAKSTMGVEQGVCFKQVNSKVIKQQIWDTAGQERFRSVTRNYFRGSIGVVIVYDITNPDSFEQLRVWLTDVKRFARSEATYLIFGNKADLAASGQRKVNYTDGAALAQENGKEFL